MSIYTNEGLVKHVKTALALKTKYMWAVFSGRSQLGTYHSSARCTATILALDIQTQDGTRYSRS